MSPRLTRLELALVAVIFAIGFGLRAAYPSRMAVEHFDEGVYASNLYTLEGRYPFQHLYAPPLLPFCLELASIFGPHVVMWVNVVSGVLTLLVLWGMVRQWWGPPAAIAAMVLLAFNEFHIAYSRAALTDAMLGLWMTAGVWAGWRAIQFGGAANIVAAGVLASLAWWTKYNGWLTLAITGSGTAGWILFDGGRPAAPKVDTVLGAGRVYLGRWAATAAIAFLLWSPWLWELQQYGGYAAVAENHKGYFSGLSGWWDNAIQQLAALRHYMEPVSPWQLQLLLPIAAAVLAVAVCRTGDTDRSDETRLGGWLIAAWLIGLSVAVPLYRAYPRLAMPWLLAAIVSIVAICGWVLRRTKWASGGISARSQRALAATGIIAGCVLAYWRGVATAAVAPTPPWQSRTSLETIANDIIKRIEGQPGGMSCLIAVLAEPGLFFQLGAPVRDSSVTIAVPVADFGVTRESASQKDLNVYVVVGAHADQAEADRLIKEGRLEAVAEFEYRPSDLVLLDGRPAWDLPPRDKPVVERIRLLHVKQ